MALMATWEITITCRDGSRLRFSERLAPLKGDIFATADTGQIIKARIAILTTHLRQWLVRAAFRPSVSRCFGRMAR
jgi:hypothetical protein